MNVKAFALAGGILWGFLVFVVTLIQTARGAGHTLVLLNSLYVGYSVTYLGAVIGLVYGFVSGALLCAVFCWLYDRFAGVSGTAK
jgi:hypothetical protein